MRLKKKYTMSKKKEQKEKKRKKEKEYSAQSYKSKEGGGERDTITSGSVQVSGSNS